MNSKRSTHLLLINVWWSYSNSSDLPCCTFLVMNSSSELGLTLFSMFQGVLSFNVWLWRDNPCRCSRNWSTYFFFFFFFFQAPSVWSSSFPPAPLPCYRGQRMWGKDSPGEAPVLPASPTVGRAWPLCSRHLLLCCRNESTDLRASKSRLEPLSPSHQLCGFRWDFHLHVDIQL